MVHYDPQEKELVRRLDSRIIPLLILSVISTMWLRTWILMATLPSYATRYNLDIYFEQPTNYEGVLAKLALISLLVGNFLFGIPSTIYGRKFGPSSWSCIMMLSWAVMELFSLFVQSDTLFWMTRFLIGGFISCLIPGMITHILTFYTREEQAVRFSFILSSAYLATEFFLVAIEYSKISAIPVTWVLVLIMLGAGSIGCILFIFLPAFPETCSFLNPADRILAVMREQEGYSQESTFVTRTTHINTKKRVVKFNFDEGLEMIKDINLWLSVAQTTIVVVILEYLVILLPQLHSDIYPVSADCGQGCRDVLSMFVFSMAPFIAGVPCSFYASSYADRNHDRTLVSMYSILLGSAGFAFIAILPSNMVSYFLGVFPSVVAMMCILPSVIAQCGDLATNETQKTTVGGVIGAFGFTLGYFINSSLRVFVARQGLSLKIILGFLILSIVMICYTRFSPSNTQNQSFDRNRAPGLRRLMNDTDEANAWGIEMDENSIKKSNAVKSYDATAKFETVEI